MLDYPKTSRVIQEQLEDIRDEGHAIVKRAEAENRELSPEEADRVLKICDDLAPELKAELASAQHNEEALKKRSKMIWNNRDNMPQAVLPTNGVAVEDQPRKTQARVVTKKLSAFRSADDAYGAGQWVKALVSREFNRFDEGAEEYCHNRGWALSNASTEGAGGAGGYLVPTPLSQTLIDVRERVGVIRQLLNVMPMTADTLSVPKRAGGLTVYGGGENPSADMTSSDKEWKQVKLVADKRYVVHQISQELSDDAIINVVDDAFQEMGYAMALAEDTEAIDGDGTSTYRGVTGIKNAIGSAGVYTAGSGDDTWAELAIEDFTGTMGKLPSQFHRSDRLAWLCSSAFYYGVMVKLLTAAGGNTVQHLEEGGDMMRPRFLGYPVFLSDRMPTATAASTKACYFGNWHELGILGDRGGIRIARSDDYAFLRDLTTLKATSRYDIVLHEPGDSSSAGAVVALSTNS